MESGRLLTVQAISYAFSANGIVTKSFRNDYAASNHSNPHIANPVSSLIKMFLPTIAGCAHVGFSAT
jgi:hypothetical protein